VDTVAGVERIEIRGEAPRLNLAGHVQIGRDASTAEQAPDEFAWVASVSVGPDRNIYVSDIYRDQVLVFDSTGEPLLQFGREGGGPGEFESLYSLAWIADTLLTLDIGNARLGRRTLAGDWLTSDQAPGRLVASPVTYRLYQVGSDEVYQWAYRPDEDVLEASWRGLGTAAGAEWERWTPIPEAGVADKVVCTMGRGFSWFDHPYAARGLAHPAPDSSVYVADTHHYRITRVHHSGDTVRTIERSVPEAPLTDEAWREVASSFGEWLVDKDRSACQPRDLERPRTKPPIEGIMVDVTGRLWVERNLVSGTLWEVFSDTGELLAAVGGFAHDRQRTVPWLGEGRVAWAARDSLDIPYVYTARMPLLPEGQR